MKVDVYWNLHKNCFSVRHKGKVIDHVQCITLHNVEFVVQPAGNARVRATKRKNVHAFARGHIIHYRQLDMSKMHQNYATYNPYKYTTFVDTGTARPVRKADYAVFTTDHNIPTDRYTPSVQYHDIIRRG